MQHTCLEESCRQHADKTNSKANETQSAQAQNNPLQWTPPSESKQKQKQNEAEDRTNAGRELKEGLQRPTY